MSYVGVNIGALTVKVAALKGDARSATVLAHQGRPLEILDDILARQEFADAEYFGVSGQLGHISEVAAIQRALREVDGAFDAVASLGGESFLVYSSWTDGSPMSCPTTNARREAASSSSSRSAGWGSAWRKRSSDPSRARSCRWRRRCSVHCKSDITHKLNRNEATPEDILHTLHDSMANKVVALLEKGQRELQAGAADRRGDAQRRDARRIARQAARPPSLSCCRRVRGSKLGAPLCSCGTHPRYRRRRSQLQPSLGRLPPLHLMPSGCKSLPRRRDRLRLKDRWCWAWMRDRPPPRPCCSIPRHAAVVASHYARTNGDPVAATRECLQALCRASGQRRIGLIGTTGSARELVGAYLGTEHVYNEISAHAAGATHFDPEVDTIFEIGGQDSQVHLPAQRRADRLRDEQRLFGGHGFLSRGECPGRSGHRCRATSPSSALAAPSPVHFKATCAAFINSDIRSPSSRAIRATTSSPDLCMPSPPTI